MAKYISVILIIEMFYLVATEAEFMNENDSLDKSTFNALKSPHFKYIPAERRDLLKKNDFFFAKNLKSVPRIGRRNDFFAKTAAKSIPRIGRRDVAPAWMDVDGVSAWPWLRDEFGIASVKRDFGRGLFHDEDFLKHLELTKELDEPRLQPVVQEY